MGTENRHKAGLLALCEWGLPMAVTLFARLPPATWHPLSPPAGPPRAARLVSVAGSAVEAWGREGHVVAPGMSCAMWVL